ncbi:MAG: diguanylate cyclase [Actinobacteria bacterium]|nr:diguanylate cyclase [Actinomycetota bacterium]
MKYSRFELLAMVVGVCAVAGTIAATVSSTNRVSDIFGQAMILLVLFGGLHYGRKGALASFVAATAIYAVVALVFSTDIDRSTALQIFLLRTAVFAIVAFVAGELNVRLKYLFIKLEHHDYVDDITSLYNSKYLAKLIDKYISEFDRYGTKFSLMNITINDEMLHPLKKKTRNKVIRDIGNSVIRGSIRGADEAARIEGTMFAVLFPNTNFDGATCATLRMKSKVAGYLDRHGLDARREDCIRTVILEYPKDKDTVEVLGVNLRESRHKDTVA